MRQAPIHIAMPRVAPKAARADRVRHPCSEQGSRARAFAHVRAAGARPPVRVTRDTRPCVGSVGTTPRVVCASCSSAMPEAASASGPSRPRAQHRPTAATIPAPATDSCNFSLASGLSVVARRGRLPRGRGHRYGCSGGGMSSVTDESVFAAATMARVTFIITCAGFRWQVNPRELSTNQRGRRTFRLQATTVR